VLASLARVLGTVKGFVHENRKALGDDVELLTSLLERVDNQKDNLGLVVQKGSSALSNLAIAFESGTGTYGSRVQLAPGDGPFNLDKFLCSSASVLQVVCPVLAPLLELLTPAPANSLAKTAAPKPTAAPTEPAAPSLPEVKVPTLESLLGGDVG
jgi:phospholipid/cholesterol/gamma-HCH transport system substrate-binding protein